MKNNKGITMIVLVITILIIIILSSLSMYVGKNAIDVAKEQRFIEELKEVNEAVQQNINEIKSYDEYRNLEESKKTISIGGNNIEYHLKLETEEDYNKIGLSNINDTIYVNLENEKIYSEKGYNGKYTLNEFGIDYYEPEKTVEEIKNVSFNISLETDEEGWRLVIRDSLITCNGKVEDGNLLYSEYINGEKHTWKRVLKKNKDKNGRERFVFENNKLGTYEFKFKDSKGYESEIQTITVYEQDGKILTKFN